MALNSEISPAWIETSDGQKSELGRTCSVGRSSSNDLVLPHDGVSRKHALIHTQDQNEYWLVDFGSSNGTWVNGKRVTRPTRLHNNDHIKIADINLRFNQQLQAGARDDSRMTVRSTSHETRTARCWLLLADIVSSTRLSESYSEKDIVVLLGKWFFDCKQIIDANAGVINKFLGDGFFAYWEDKDGVDDHVAKTIAGLKELQNGTGPRFRIAMHFGEISIGGSPLMLEELIGRPVNFLFRMEKLGAKLQSPCLLSGPARKRLPQGASAQAAGDHPVAGFDGDFPFFTL